MRSAALIVAALTTIPAMAFAQEPPPAAEAEVEGNLDRSQIEDPNVDRGMILPTAQTQPKGTFAFNDYELFLMGLTYGITDDLQVTATTLAPITTDMPLFLVSNVKLRVVKTGRVRLAVIGGIGLFNDSPVSDDEGLNEDVTLFSLTGGGAATFCLTDDCHSSANFTVTASKGFAEDDSSGVGLIYGGSILARTSKHTKIVVEATSAAGTDNGDFTQADGALLTYGVRFFSDHIAGDVGFLRPIGLDSDEDSDEFLLGIPFVALTYRN